MKLGGKNGEGQTRKRDQALNSKCVLTFSFIVLYFHP